MHAQPTRTIFITGGDFSTPFIKYVISLTHKSNPRICYIPTASADNPDGIIHWYETCAELPMHPYVLRTFINSRPDQQTFEETILSMDAIVVGGGSTLNMIAVWKAQGIDTVLRKAYEKGIIMAGGSAGSLCWFISGITDSRPKQLTLVDCLGFIRTSHCPHYHSEPGRKPLYQQEILSGHLPAGYACDDRAALLILLIHPSIALRMRFLFRMRMHIDHHDLRSRRLHRLPARQTPSIRITRLNEVGEKSLHR
jgi:dipeptidase E